MEDKMSRYKKGSRIVLLCGDSRRHRYVANRINNTQDLQLIGIVTEKKRPPVVNTNTSNNVENKFLLNRFLNLIQVCMNSLKVCNFLPQPDLFLNPLPSL